MAGECFDRALRLSVLTGWLLALGSSCAGDANAPSDTLDARLDADVRTYAGQCDDRWPYSALAVVEVGADVGAGKTVRRADYDSVHGQCRGNVGCGDALYRGCGNGDRISCECCYGETCILAGWLHECSIGSDD